MKLLKKIGSFFKKIALALGRWVKKHKRLAILLLVLFCIGGFFGYRVLKTKNAGGQQSTYSFIRTTTLTKGDLNDSVSCTGTVGSTDTSTVTYSSTGNSAVPKIKTVNVAVGDTVQAGDVIVTLDSSDIEESIAKEKENLSEKITEAQEKYDAALTAYNKAVDVATAYETTLQNAKSTLDTASVSYTNAQNSVASFQTTYDNAVSAQETAGTAYNEKTAAYNAALAAAAADPTNTVLTAAVSSAEAEMNNAAAAYTAAGNAAQNAKNALDTAKNACNYETYAQAYNAAQQAYTQARTTLDQYEKAVDTCTDTLGSSKKTLENASTSDTLETLQESLANCSLTAETAGKVTALSASVGNTPNGTIATIQDTASLKISITIEEADINSVSVGMSCLITSDATDTSIAGTLTQIDPVAGQSGGFGAEVTVNTENSGLLIGMNATVEIIRSSTSDCFMVPIDAVGNEQDHDFVYRQTGGSGTDMTFEKVTVTTGAANDYYIEITSSELAQGDVIRSSADLTQGIEETTADTSNDFSSMFGGGMMMGGSAQAMPSGDATVGHSGTRPSGGGTPPAGGMGGGQ